MMMIFFAGSCTWQFRDSLPAVLTVFAFLLILTEAAHMDMAIMKISDKYHMLILIIAGISCFTMPGITLASRAAGFVCVSVPLLFITLIAPGAFGGGDIKLMAVCGVFLGWKNTLASAVIAVIFGGVWGIYLLAVRKKERKERFAFGACLCLGMALGVFFGDWMIGWYMG